METIQISESLKKRVSDFLEELKRVYGNGLVSVALYGSILDEVFSEKHSDINILAVLDDTSIEKLARIKPVLNKRAYQNYSVVFFTEQFIRTSADVFPIEFIEMKERYAVLFGSDILAGISLDTRNLRFQTELELRSLLVKARQFYLSNLNKNLLKYVLFKNATRAVFLVKNIIRVKKGDVSKDMADILRTIGSEYAVDTAVLNRIVEAKKNDERLSYPDTERLYFQFVGALEKIVGIVDTL